MKHKLTARQRKFIDAYIECGNAKEAAIEAGYSRTTAKQMGRENLTKPYLKAEIEKHMQAIEDDKIADAKEVLQYFTQVVRGTARETVAVPTMDGVEQVDNPPTIKDRLAAGKEILKRYPGVSELLDAQTRKAKAEADITEMQRDAMRGEGYKNPLLDAIAKGAAGLLPKEDDQSDEN